MNRYVLPNFDDYIPQFIDISIKKIKKSHLYNANYTYNVNNERYKEALLKLKESNNIKDLSKRDIKILSNNLITLENLGLFDKYYKLLEVRAKDIRNKNYFIRPLLNYLYNGNKNKGKVYELVKKFGKAITRRKERYEDILNLFNKSTTSSEFIKNAKEKFIIDNKREIDTICEKLLIKPTDEIYSECIIEFIYYNYLDENLWTFHKKTIKVMKLDLRKKIFKKILLLYEDEINVSEYPERWFRFIYEQLGDPYDPANVKWRGLEDVKEIFRRWNIDKNIEKFFEKIVGGDKRRKRFWKQYINNIYRIEYFEKASKALVMEFKNHLFVEFAKIGACYYYDKRELNINEINSKINSSNLSKTKKINFLKQGYDKKDHRGRWEYRFDYIIENLGYRKSRWS
ncbi:MAG: hypothetical protein FH751_14435 [Firmicutes bacterium]|nr:hypothetical protein [Bacillota bacterium]